jgi:phosphoribosyl 1,2-cyclic phosphate phosphodiesterase
MNARRTLLVLGCGTSLGVPQIGCDCSVCLSPNPKNQRTRSSVLLRLPGGNLLIDTTPELRLQMTRERVPFAHAILYTHYHVDHLYGLDDARLFPKTLGAKVPVYCTDEVEAVVREVFRYAFDPVNANVPAGHLPQLAFRRISPTEPFDILGERVTPIPLIHGRFNCLGFRFGDVAYCTDVSRVPETSYPLLEGLDVLFLDALRPERPHPTHFTIEQALEVIERVRPKRAFLTHTSHEIDYDEWTAKLPPGVELSYDGLRVEF